MEFQSVVRGEASQYYAEIGAVNKLEEKVTLFKTPIIITGEKSYQAFLDVREKEPEFPVLRYDRTVSHENMDLLASQAKELGADLLIGIGGGKVLDTTKGTAERLNVDFVLIPTVAGTCACATPVAAVYNPDHSFKCVDYYQRSGFLTLVDYDLLVKSPREYLIGGICDTLAKWYESEIINRQKDKQELPAMVQLGLAAAKVSIDVLLKDTKASLQSHSKEEVTPAFERVVDTVFAVSAYVGCLACEAGRMAGAHAIHNGLTQYSETNTIQHGVKVAYGILVQLCATNDIDEVKKLVPFYQENGFIYSWDQLHITSASFEEAAHKVAKFAASDRETFNLAVKNVTTEEVYQAMVTLEDTINSL